MAIYIGSRYEFDPLYSIACPRGGDHNHLTLFANPDNSNRANTAKAYKVYVVVDGDRLDALAYAFYGDASKWWYIADANPDTAYDVTTMTAGTLLRIPNAAG